MLKGKDTLWDYVVRDEKMRTNKYNDTLLQVDYVELDRDVIYTFENGVLKDSTVYSMPGYRDNSYYYDQDGRLVAEDIFARDDKVMTKIKFEYDSLGRVVTEYMDRTFYNKPGKEAEWELRYKYEYVNSEKIVTWFLDGDEYDIQSFDSHGNVTGYKRYTKGKTEFDDRYEYTYKDGKITKTIELREGEHLITCEYFYDNQGFFKEERVTTNAETTILRYYYN
jgi:hypothetical protein